MGARWADAQSGRLEGGRADITSQAHPGENALRLVQRNHVLESDGDGGFHLGKPTARWLREKAEAKQKILADLYAVL